MAATKPARRGWAINSAPAPDRAKEPMAPVKIDTDGNHRIKMKPRATPMRKRRTRRLWVKRMHRQARASDEAMDRLKGTMAARFSRMLTTAAVACWRRMKRKAVTFNRKENQRLSTRAPRKLRPPCHAVRFLGPGGRVHRPFRRPAPYSDGCSTPDRGGQ